MLKRDPSVRLEPWVSEIEKRIDVRRRCRSGPFCDVVKVEIQAPPAEIGPQYDRIGTLILDRNGKVKFPIELGGFEQSLIADFYNRVHALELKKPQ
jgi:hypothetical protein